MTTLNVLCLQAGCMRIGQPEGGPDVSSLEDFTEWGPVKHIVQSFEGRNVKFHFCPAPNDIGKNHSVWGLNYLPKQEGLLYQWYEPDGGTLSLLEDSLATVNQFIVTEMGGKVDILLGFSQGATVAMKMFELLPGMVNNVRGAIFINSGGEYDSKPRRVDNDRDKFKVNNDVKSLHIMGLNCHLLKFSSKIHKCFHEPKLCYEHGADHMFMGCNPSLSSETMAEVENIFAVSSI